MFESFSWIRRLSQAGTVLITRLSGVKVGQDSFGNSYYSLFRRQGLSGKERRWVLYAGEPEASKIPPEWYAWMHHMAERPLPIVCDQPLPNVVVKRYGWQKPHHPNLTGTEAALIPSGYGLNLLIEGRSRKAPPTYQAWTPPT